MSVTPEMAVDEIVEMVHLIVREYVRRFTNSHGQIDFAKIGGYTGRVRPQNGGTGVDTGLRDHNHSGESGQAQLLAEANTHENLNTDPLTAIHWTQAMLTDLIGESTAGAHYLDETGAVDLPGSTFLRFAKGLLNAESPDGAVYYPPLALDGDTPLALTPVLDGGGDPVLDSDGNPVYVYNDLAALDPFLLTLPFVIDGGGSAITTGIKGDLEVPDDCTIVRATALADQTGSIVVDVWRDTYAAYPPVDADSITGSAPVTISGANKSQDTTLTGWTTALAAGDTLRFNVDSAATIQRVTISLCVRRT